MFYADDVNPIIHFFDTANIVRRKCQTLYNKVYYNNRSNAARREELIVKIILILQNKNDGQLLDIVHSTYYNIMQSKAR